MTALLLVFLGACVDYEDVGPDVAERPVGDVPDAQPADGEIIGELTNQGGIIEFTVAPGITNTSVVYSSTIYTRGTDSLTFGQTVNALGSFISYPDASSADLSSSVHTTFMQAGAGTKYFAEKVSVSYGGDANQIWRHFKAVGTTITNLTTSQWDAQHEPASSWVDENGYEFKFTRGTEFTMGDVGSPGQDDEVVGVGPKYSGTTTPGPADDTDESLEN